MATTEATNTQQTASTEKGKEPRFFDAAIYAKKLKDALTELAKKRQANCREVSASLRY